jgi:hypothetical protein
MIVSEMSIGQSSLITTQRFPKTLIYGNDTIVAYTLNQEKDIFKTYIERDKFKELYQIDEKIILSKDSIIENLEYSNRVQENTNKLYIEENTSIMNQNQLYKDKITILDKDIQTLNKENDIIYNRFIKARKQRNKFIIVSIVSTVGLITMTYFVLK